MSNVITDYKYNIEQIDFSEGFFVKSTLDNLGEDLFQAYKSSETPTVVTTSGITDNGVTFKASHSNRFYIGSYRTQWSSWDGNNRVETFFAIFYKYPSDGPTTEHYVDITFPKGYIGIRPNIKHDLTIRRTIDSDSFWVPDDDALDSTFANKLIPIFAFHSKNRRCNSYSGDTGSLSNYLGWCYPYYAGSTAGSVLDHLVPSNIVTGYNNVFGSCIKTTFIISGIDAQDEAGSRIPVLVLDMNNGQRSSNASGEYLPSTWKKKYSEGFIVDTSYVLTTNENETTKFITGSSKTSGIAPETTSTASLSNLPAPSTNLAYVQSWKPSSALNNVHFVGDRGIKGEMNPQPNWTEAQYSMACGVAFFLDATASSENGRSFYTTGSWGISQLFPARSIETKTIHFYRNYTDSDTTKVSGTVYVNDPYGNNSYGWPMEGDDNPSWINRTGYRLKGWYTERTGGTKVSANKMVRSSTASPIELYAQWEAIQYTLTYDVNGGNTLTPSYKTGYYDSPWGTLATPTRTGYSFSGWFTTKTGTTEVTSETICKGDRTVYAHWSANTYYVRYDYKNGTPYSGSNDYNASQSYTIENSFNLRQKPTYAGYAFQCWKVKANAGSWVKNDEYAEKEEVNTNHNMWGTVYLNAQWTTNDYTAYFNPNGGTWSDDASTTKTVTYTIEQVLKAPTTISRTGYSFAGWKISTTAGNWPVVGTIYNNSTQTKLEGVVGFYGNVRFEAQWTEHTYTIDWNLGDGGHWESNQQGYNSVSSDGYLYNPNGTIKYNTIGSIEGVTKSWFRTEAPSRQGYTFDGYTITGMDSSPHSVYENSAERIFTDTSITTGTDTVSKTPTMKHLRADDNSSKHVLFTAKWNINQYELTLNSNSAASAGNEQYAVSDISGMPSQNPRGVNYNVLLSTTYLPNLTSSSHDFVKWNTKKTGAGTDYVAGTDRMPANDLTLYAIWSLKVFHITYQGLNGATAPSKQTFTAAEQFDLATISKTGFEFQGWRLVSGTIAGYSIGDTVTRIPRGTKSDITVRAIWTVALQPFTPKPGEPPEDQEFFGIPIDELPTGYYKLELSVEGDRSSTETTVYRYTQGIDYSQYGIDTSTDKWSYASSILSKTQLQTLLRSDTGTIFPMDVWRCRIWHERAVLTVKFTTYEKIDGEYVEIGTSTLDNEFKIGDENIPVIENVVTKEGVVNILNLDLGKTGGKNTDIYTTPRFIGNKKSSVIADITATNKKNGVEMLYEAIPYKFIMMLSYEGSRTDAQWNSGEVSRTVPAAQRREFVASYQEENHYTATDILVHDAPFPLIDSDLTDAKLKIKILDSRHGG